MKFLGWNCFESFRRERKIGKRGAAPRTVSRRLGAEQFSLEPLEDRRMLAVLNLGVNILADVSGTPGNALPVDTVNVGDTFYVEILALDEGGASGGIKSLALDVSWDGTALELLNVPFNPVSSNDLVTANFPLSRGGTLSAGQDSIDELRGASNPPADGFVIGNGSAQRFSLMRFRADAPVSASSFAVALGAGGVTFSNGDALANTVIDPQTITVATATPTITINDVTLAEGNSGATSFTFTVSVANLGANPVSASFATADAFATIADSDYSASSGTLNFTPGLIDASTKTITITVNGDTLPEGNETFLVNLSNASANATIGDGQGVGTITNDDGSAPAALSISDAQVVEGDSGLPLLVFTVNLTNAPATPVTVNYSAQLDTASPSDNDFHSTSGTLTFTPGTLGATQQTISVEVVGDTKVELTETMHMLLSNANGATIADGDGLGTITNDDVTVVSIADISKIEGNSGTSTVQVTVSITKPAAVPITVALNTADGTATTANSDYVAVSNQLITIPAGETSATAAITINGDTADEGNEAFEVNISDARFGGNSAPSLVSIGDADATVTITNDDTTAVAAVVSIADVTIAEGASGTSQATVTITMSAAASGDVTVRLNTTSGTATIADSDFVGVADQLITIPSGQTSVTASILINGDVKVELNENFVVSLSDARIGGVVDPSSVTIGDGEATITITNDDVANVTINDVTHVEGNADFDFTITLSNPVDVAVTVVTNVGNVTIPAGQTSGTLAITVSNADDNNIVEGERVATINVTSVQATGRNVVITDNVGEAIVTDNDTSILTINDITQNEAQGNFVFTLTLSNPVAIDVFVDVQAPEGTDTITIPANALTKTFTVLFDDNDIVEFDFPFQINITDIDADGLPVTLTTDADDKVGEGLVLDDDFADVAITDVSITEGNAGTKNLVFTVTLSKEVDADVTIDFATSDGTATAGSDYTAATGTITFPRPVNVSDPFITSRTITIVLSGDTVVEADETFTITLSNLEAEGLEDVGVFLTDATATGTITNDDANVPTLVISDGTLVTEGNSGTQNMVFTVTLTNPPATAVQVEYDTVDGTAKSLELDYSFTFGVLTFTPSTAGATQQTITVPILGDVKVEGDETFTLMLSNATQGVTIGDAEGLGTIADDDAATISINDVSLAEGQSGTTNFAFVVTLSGPVEVPVTVVVNTANGTATAGSDYTAITNQTITFTPGGPLTQTVTVQGSGDTAVEGDETFTVTLSNLQAGGAEVTIADATGQGTILNDDTAAAGTLSIADATIAEGTGAGTTQLSFTVTLSAALNQAVSFTVNSANGTATTADGDYTAVVNQVVTIPAGQTTAQVLVTVGRDSKVEANETISVTLSAPIVGDGTSGQTVSLLDATATGTITNDDAATLSINDVSQAEALGDQTFTITMSNPVDVAVTVSVTDGTNSQNVTIPAGQTTATFVVAADDNNIVQFDFDYTVTMSNVQASGRNVTIADATGMGTILDDDFADVQISNVTLTEGNAGTKNFTFTVTLTNPVEADVTMTFATSNGTATAGSDYVAQTGTVSFLVPVNPDDPLIVSQTITIVVNGDTDIEADETFIVTLSNLDAEGLEDPTIEAVAFASGQATQTATGTITNDDTATGPTISIGDASVVEGNNSDPTMTFTITLSAAITSAVSFVVNTADGTATAANDDYAPISNQTVTFNPGGPLTQTVSVIVGSDTRVEANETFTVTLSGLQAGGTGATFADATATGTITNDDTATISIADATVNEGNSGTTTMTFNITMSQAADVPVSFVFNTSNGTATAGTDYTAIANQTVTIAAGQTTASVTVNVTGDTLVEVNETISATLSALDAGGRDVTLSDATATGTITNDDSATISVADVTVTEGNSGTTTMTFTVTLSQAVDTAITLSASTADGTATTANSDYTAVSNQTITFTPGGPLTQTVTVNVTGDTAVEANETLLLNLTNLAAGGRNVTISDAQATGTITNDDGPGTVFLSIADVTVNEGNSGTTTMTFTVTMTAAVESPVTVTVNSANGTATSGTDYTALVNQTVTIPAGQTSATVTVSVTGDLTVEADENFTLTLSNPLFNGATNLARVALDTDNSNNVDNVATGTITNDDIARLSVANVALAEGTGATPTVFTLTVTLSNPVDRAVTYTVNTADGTATVAGSDYTALTNQTFTIAAGQTTGTFTLNVTADSAVEANETLTVTLSNPLFDGVADTTRVALDTDNTDNIDNVATVTINDDDGIASITGVVFVDADNDGVRDTGETGVPGVQVTLRRTDITGQADVVILTGNDGTYTFSNVTPGTYSIIESHPTAFVDGADAVGSLGGTLANDSVTAVTVAGGAAGTGYNFGERGLAPTFVSKNLFLGSTPDAQTTLRELNARAAELAGNTALASAIRNGSTSVINATVSISDAAVSESNSGTTTLTFNVTLSSASDAPVTVTVNTANGTATTADNDYVALANQTVTFAVGGPLTQTVTVTLNGDTRVEANETFNVNLSNIQANGRNITIADGSAIGTINNDDAATVSVNDVSITEGASGTANATFTVTLTNAVDTNVSVTVNTANGTALTTDNDYTALTNQTVTFTPGGALTQTFTVPIVGDARVEANETFNVNLSGLAASDRNVTISDGTGVGTITNDDSATVNITDRAIVEGNSGTTNMVFTVTMSNPVDTAVTLNATTANGTATAGTDYAALVNQPVTFNAGTTTTTVTVQLTGDTAVETNETFQLTLSGLSAGGRNVTLDDAVATGTITNDDGVSVSVADVSLAEGNSGTTNMVFTVTLSGAITSNVTVTANTSNGTATAGADYTAVSNQTITFTPGGSLTQTITVPITGDTTVEPNETLILTLSNLTGSEAFLGDATATGTITNDDTATVSVAAASVAEGNTGSSNLVYTITLSNAVSSNVTVTVNTSNGTATAGADYTAVANQTVTFTPGGSLTQTVNVPVAGDTTVEADETLTLTLSNLTGTGVTLGASTAIGTITNDDAATASIANQTVTEGNSGQTAMAFTVTLSAPVDVPVSVTANSAPGSATIANNDYTAITDQVITFQPGGSLTQTVTSQIIGDTAVEPNETFTVTIGSLSAGGRNVTIGTATATGTITNDDNAAAASLVTQAAVSSRSLMIGVGGSGDVSEEGLDGSAVDAAFDDGLGDELDSTLAADEALDDVLDWLAA